MLKVFDRIEDAFGRDGKVTYKEVANYMSMNHNVEHAARMSTSHMRKAVIHMGLQMDDVFRRCTREHSAVVSVTSFLSLCVCM